MSYRLCCSLLLCCLFYSPLPAEPGQTTSTAALQPAQPEFSPGPEYADAVRQFQGIPAIERAAKGRLWAAWYGGGITEDEHNYIILETSGDEGKTWQRVMILDPDREGPVRAFDPCLWHDPQGRLWLFWAQRIGGGPATLFAINTADSADAKPTWTKPRMICDGILMNKPILTHDGRWLLPVAIWKTAGSSRVVASADQGRTFKLLGAANVPNPKDRNCDEHMLLERKDHALWMLTRTRYGIGESKADAQGQTWRDVVPTSLTRTVSRFFLRRLASGRVLLVRHTPPGDSAKRSHLTAWLSDDDGRTWQGGLMLDERVGVSYPDGVQASDGVIYLIYDYNRLRDKQILLATFTEVDILASKPVDPKARLRVQINQATGVNPFPHGHPKPKKSAQ